jgi:hypothetical protein
MDEPFVLTAVPQLLPEGPHEGYLGCVEFKATNGVKSYGWLTGNAGNYLEDFSKLLPRAEAKAVVAALQRGEKVIVPGYWTIDEIRQWWGSVWNIWDR